MSPTNRRQISDIRIGERHRKDQGDLAGLAKSIEEQGLLQPIGILPDGELVFGHRRLVACRDHLGWTEIDVRIVDVTSVVLGEMHENEMRKNFTPSERLAIFKSIKTRGAGRPKEFVSAETNLPSKDEAARTAGFAGRGVAYRVADVVDMGTPELVEAMDNGEVKIARAAEIARAPRAEQPQLVAAAKVARATPKKRAAKPPAASARSIGQIVNERQARAAARPELTDEEKELPPPELENEQHPDYPKGVTYAMAYREENGRVQLWPLAEKRRIQTLHRWQEALGALGKLDLAELDSLNPSQRQTILIYARKLLCPIVEWAERNSGTAA